MNSIIEHQPKFDEVLHHHFESGEAGPHLLILGGIHGNETCGQEALNKLKAQLENGKVKLLKGSLTLVPQANPWACAANVRYVEKNLNRVIAHNKNPQAYEERIATQIAALIDACDVLVDLHSISAVCPGPFVFNDYPGPKNNEIARILGGEYIVTGWADKFTEQYPEHEIASTVSYADQLQKPGVLIECGRHTDPKAAEVAYTAAFNTLVHQGLTEGEIKVPELKAEVLISYVHVKREEGAFISSDMHHMQELKKGDHIATYSNGEKIYAPAEGYLLLPFHGALVGNEWFYYGIRR